MPYAKICQRTRNLAHQTNYKLKAAHVHLEYFFAGIWLQHLIFFLLQENICFHVVISKQTCKFLTSSAFIVSWILEFPNIKTNTTGSDLTHNFFKWMPGGRLSKSSVLSQSMTSLVKVFTITSHVPAGVTHLLRCGQGLCLEVVFLHGGNHLFHFSLAPMFSSLVVNKSDGIVVFSHLSIYGFYTLGCL